MRRWAVKVGAILVLGAVTTVVVAWGFAVTTNLMASTHEPGFLGYATQKFHDEYGQMVIANEGAGTVLVFSSVERLDGVAFHYEEATIRLEDGEQQLTTVPAWALPARCLPAEGHSAALGYAIAHGFPAPALAAYFHDPANDWKYNSGGSFEVAGMSAIVVGEAPNNLSPPRSLPIRPIFPGFLIDSVFFGAIWAVIVFGLAVARRATRRKRGRCPSCGYDIRGLPEPRCPECGMSWEW